MPLVAAKLRLNDDTIHIKGHTMFAYTIKARKRAMCNQLVYTTLFAQWRLEGCKITVCSEEYDKIGRLHYHGIVVIPSEVRYSALCPKREFTYHFFPILTETNRRLWFDYCHKDIDLITQVPPRHDFSPPKVSLFR